MGFPHCKYVGAGIASRNRFCQTFTRLSQRHSMQRKSKVGSKVTNEYRVVATEVDVKDAKEKAKK